MFKIPLQGVAKNPQKEYSEIMTDRIDIPTITTSRLTLRPFTLEDVIPLHRIVNEPGIMKYFPRTDPPDMERVKKLIARQFMQYETYNLGWWAVIPKGQTDLIGWNGLQFIPETEEIEVGYLLSKPYWGQGFATEGAKAALNFGFEKLRLKEIIGLTHPENTASQNVLKKCGMQYTEQKEYFGLLLYRFCLKSPSIS